MFEALRHYQKSIKSRNIFELCKNAEHVAKLSASTHGLCLDASKTNLDDHALALFLTLFETRGVAENRDRMFDGEKINTTEDRSVLHVALRAKKDAKIMVDGVNVVPDVHETLLKMSAFADDVRSGRFLGQGGQITDVINIGIGGSDLGPAMAVRALQPYHDGPRVHFVSNVDPADISDTIGMCDPQTTLVVVASKTFTTIETMTNADTAKAWMAKSVDEPAKQFAALSSAEEKTADYGIAENRVFGFDDWVGGRYSVWGPIGLSVMLAIGPKRFDEFLAGGRAMDDHFQEAPFDKNLPVLMATVGLWHNQICGYPTRAVLPYDNRLGRFPAYLQQLDMESNGKGVSLDGEKLVDQSGPVVWGEPGTNGQHAFYQLIHQGTQIVPCEFLVAARGHEPELHHQHRLLVANCLAQSEALMRGRTLDEARDKIRDKFTGAELDRQAAHRVFEGNRPSITLTYEQLTPFVLGQLIACYEHRVFVEGVVMGVNSYDQWGVELGKELATALQPIVDGRESAEGKDVSTATLINTLKSMGL